MLFTATYHLYVGDAVGNPVSDYGDASTVWRWQGSAVPVVPTAAIASTNGQILVSWMPTLTNLSLVAADSLTATTQSAVTNEPFLLDGRSAVFLNPAVSVKFFRLRLNV